ncbi:spore germination protein [Lysinibacillus sp. BW-2-10]|uniref:spore germination protein n=1 Tax=Lysinibacillus sp. BW-2-10 TaxID=2590030 RepID=UPI00117F15CB|nr:spore germination protein [Lysinibacillus sp. BW-2-10]TSI06203.1 spore germination protein [Lysinibacillus sp. BW-2-10]
MSPFFKKRTKATQPKQTIPKSEIMINNENKQVSSCLEKNVEHFEEIFKNDMDFLVRKFYLFETKPAALLCLKSLVGKEEIERDIIRPLQEKILGPENQDVHYITENILYSSDVKIGKEISNLIAAITTGKAIIFIDGLSESLEIDVKLPDKRSIEQPETERVVRGSRDGFIEQMNTNIALLRYRLPVPELRVERTEVGTRTRTNVAVCYMEDIVNEDLLKEVKMRIDAIQMDGVLDAGYIEQFIQDNPWSPFPQIQNTERPDKVVGNLLEGRVAILVEGSPFVLIAPATFNQFYQTSEDYNERWIISSIVRFIRIMALIFSLTFSSFYVTVLSFHPELIPASFVVAASSGRHGVPFPVFVEVLLMELAMEILREATVRMPQQVGGALSIVGVLVVGQAAVQAGFVSPITVVIIALSTIGSFATPSYNAATAFRMLRFFLIILAGTFGLLGLAVSLMLVINHMISLRSFGVPFMFPFAPGNANAIKDSIIRAPFHWLKTRPESLNPKNKKRVGGRVKDKAPYNFLNEDGDNSEET